MLPPINADDCCRKFLRLLMCVVLGLFLINDVLPLNIAIIYCSFLFVQKRTKKTPENDNSPAMAGLGGLIKLLHYCDFSFWSSIVI